MDFLSADSSYLWLALGVVIIVFEFFVTPGLGIVFAGIGALTTGALLEAELIHTNLEQWLVFLVSTTLWALLLWRPLKKSIANKATGKGQGHSHIIGTDAIIAEIGVTKNTGAAKWSGTEMSAKLAPDCEVTHMRSGEVAHVVALEGSTLILKPKNKE